MLPFRKHESKKENIERHKQEILSTFGKKTNKASTKKSPLHIANESSYIKAIIHFICMFRFSILWKLPFGTVFAERVR